MLFHVNFCVIRRVFKDSVWCCSLLGSLVAFDCKYMPLHPRLLCYEAGEFVVDLIAYRDGENTCAHCHST